eukprot:gene15672-21198_t
MSSKAATQDSQWQAINTLVNRMKYYPLVQAICRSGAAWNEFDFGNFSTYPSQISAGICSPSTGAGYFLIFLLMQPNALKMVTELICNPSLLCFNSNENHIKKLNNITNTSNFYNNKNNNNELITSVIPRTNTTFTMNEDELAALIDDKYNNRSSASSYYSQQSALHSEVEVGSSKTGF